MVVARIAQYVAAGIDPEGLSIADGIAAYTTVLVIPLAFDERELAAIERLSHVRDQHGSVFMDACGGVLWQLFG